MDIILVPLFHLLVTVLDLYVYVIVAAVVLSWLTAFNVINTRNRFVYVIGDVIFRLTEPVLQRIRAILPNFGGLDLSPVLLILLLMVVKEVLVRIAIRFGD